MSRAWDLSGGYVVLPESKRVDLLKFKGRVTLAGLS